MRASVSQAVRRACAHAQVADNGSATLIADRAYDVDALRAWRARQGIAAVMPARARRTNPRMPPERYEARQAVERGLGGLQRGRCVATCYAARPGFSALGGRRFWLPSSLNAT